MQLGMQSPPVILGSSLSGILLSQTLSRAGIEHVVVGDGKEPEEIPRLGESLNDTASPELWRHYGRELGEYFYFKNHISYFNGNFLTLISLANPRRTRARVMKYAPERGTPRYPWFGDGLFHLDRIGFDRALWCKWREDKLCRFVNAKVTRIEHDKSSDAITRIDLSDGSSIEHPRYVFDNTGFKSIVAEAAEVGQNLMGPAQRVVFTHYRCPTLPEARPEFWRHGTNLIRLDREADSIDALAWVIPIGRTLSVGMSFDLDGERGQDSNESLMTRLEDACRRRGIDFRPLYPEELPIQNLRHHYFYRERAWGKNWLLVGGTAITIWFPSSSGLWTTTAACGMATRLLEDPSLGKFYDQSMKAMLPFHRLLDDVLHGPMWRSSAHAYRFFAKGSTFILGRVSNYLRIKRGNYGWLSPVNWFLDTLSFIGWLMPPILFVLMGGTALVRSRLSPDRSKQGSPLLLYFWTIPFRLWSFARAVPQFLWSLIPRKSLPGDRSGKPTN